MSCAMPRKQPSLANRVSAARYRYFRGLGPALRLIYHGSLSNLIFNTRAPWYNYDQSALIDVPIVTGSNIIAL